MGSVRSKILFSVLFFVSLTFSVQAAEIKLKIKDYRKIDQIFETAGIHTGLANKCYADESAGVYLNKLLDVLENYDVSIDMYKEMKEKFTVKWKAQQLRWVGSYQSYAAECKKLANDIGFYKYSVAAILGKKTTWEEELDAILKAAQAR